MRLLRFNRLYEWPTRSSKTETGGAKVARTGVPSWPLESMQVRLRESRSARIALNKSI